MGGHFLERAIKRLWRFICANLLCRFEETLVFLGVTRLAWFAWHDAGLIALKSGRAKPTTSSMDLLCPKTFRLFCPINRFGLAMEAFYWIGRQSNDYNALIVKHLRP
jgi:hypothetical protein